ncbi:hypothetical protein AB7W24_21990 [Providencia rettgeri]
MNISPVIAKQILRLDGQRAIDAINAFTFQTFKTRGGRLGSGMGSLIEAMWVYYMNNILLNDGGVAQECEIAWLQDHEPADFACLYRGAHWNPISKQGELFRIEAKSMNIGVDEAKGHFTNLLQETGPDDQLLVLIWSWEHIGDYYSWPKIHDYFLGSSRDIIYLRDNLHLKRNGSFVLPLLCPDGCQYACTHIGEPLNSAGKRERRSGPSSCKPANVEYAANFGGLIRMIKTDNDLARQAFRYIRQDNDTAHEYISFIHRNFPNEELNHFKKDEWQHAFINIVGSDPKFLSKIEMRESIKYRDPSYQDKLRILF